MSLCARLAGPLTVLAALFVATAPAAAQLRVVTYNVAGLRGDTNALGDVLAALNDDDKPGFAVAPHIYIMQEVQSEDANVITTLLNLNAPPGVLYARATYTNSGEDGASGAQALYFRTDTLFEISGDHADIYTFAGRDADRWHLELVGYDNDAASLWIYGMHLKASTGGANEDLREDGAIAVRTNANMLPQNAHVIFAGDMNLYSNSEPAYQVFTNSGTQQGIDEYGGGDWTGSGNAIKHSQSPRAVGSEDLVGGGCDDRFDLILHTSELRDSLGLAYIDGTMRSLGNDGNHYNDAINDGLNTYYPGQAARSNALADALHEASDHIPVVIEYQIPGFVSGSMPDDFGRVIQGAGTFLPILLQNTATTINALGADNVNYSLSGSGIAIASGSGILAPLAPPTNDLVFLNTSAVGPASGQVTITTSSQGAGGNGTVLGVTGTIVRPSAPSFDAGTVVETTTRVWTVSADTGVQELTVPIHNVGWDALQAALDVDDVLGTTAPVAFTGGLAANIQATPADLTFAIDTDGLAAGGYDQTVFVSTSDEDIPGADTVALTLDLVVTVESSGGVIGDVDNDGDVDFNDLLSLLAAWGPCAGACPADFDDNGIVDFNDLLALLAAWG